MTRVTYGRASSPYHSIKSLKALADSCTNSNFRLAIINDMFLDDLIRGASDEEYDTHFQDEIIEKLKTACFNIRKYTSSVLSLVERLPSCFCKTSHEVITNSNIYPLKTLGIKLSPIPEHFFFTVCLVKEFPNTKGKYYRNHEVVWSTRMVVSNKNSVELLLANSLEGQLDLGRSRFLDILEQYGRFRHQLKELEKIKLERRVSEISFGHLCSFMYAAVVYAREQMDDRVQTQMLTIQKRVAPIKILCVPRLEVFASFLGAQLCQAVKESIDDSRLVYPKVFARTDSQVTFSWIENVPRKRKTELPKFRASFRQKIGSFYQHQTIHLISDQEKFQPENYRIIQFCEREPIVSVKTSSFGLHWMLHLFITTQLTL